MKRVVSLCIILATIAATGNAQYFVEGSLTADYKDATPEFPGYPHEKQFADSYWNVSPLVGYQLNDDFAVGTKATFYKRTRTQWFPYSDNATFEETSSRRSFALFCRYKIWGTEKLSFLVESSIEIGGGSSLEKTGTIVKKIKSGYLMGIYATPLLTYDISDKWSIVTTSYLFILKIDCETVKNEETGLKTKLYDYGFNVRSSMSIPFTIGFIYHF